ncbi:MULTISPECIES: hypothetical protein [Bacillus cereus group]|uniref:Poly A polymerase head domain-containing protein n=2 Tax=Bacillus cereus group TaxID=86661 RepID=A0A9W5KT10_BACCE|nr:MULTISPECIES: hypothetical protein [Bacillus cereus group]ALZ59308.1 hypothetical protein FORC13_0247 [Bacillus cereus]EEM49822.1 hypothetical protein bthur0005_2320 [Bacillus thuringiensis serovar pakistani str. T13001]EJR68206.1 hypothetical protein IK5_05013 [Bacillus cereus VD154]KIU73071.1 hypothetical protein C797_19898 [Bacillus thuringiensis Sbt003]MBM6771629.1 hypothetical protein [Bacillus cereus]
MNKNLEIRNEFFRILSNRPNARKLISSLDENAELLLFGGCIRDYIDNRFSEVPRDFDIVINTQGLNVEEYVLGFEKISCKRNKFGGYKIAADNLKFDIWELDKTWAFKERIIECNEIADLNKTVFLNIDSIFYNLNTGDLYDEDFRNAIANNELDIVLDKNPYPELNLARAFRYKNKYNLRFSDKLNDFIANWMKDFDNKHEATDILKEIELKRYNQSTVDLSLF